MIWKLLTALALVLLSLLVVRVKEELGAVMAKSGKPARYAFIDRVEALFKEGFQGNRWFSVIYMSVAALAIMLVPIGSMEAPLGFRCDIFLLGGLFAVMEAMRLAAEGGNRKLLPSLRLVFRRDTPSRISPLEHPVLRDELFAAATIIVLLAAIAVLADQTSFSFAVNGLRHKPMAALLLPLLLAVTVISGSSATTGLKGADLAAVIVGDWLREAALLMILANVAAIAFPHPLTVIILTLLFAALVTLAEYYMRRVSLPRWALPVVFGLSALVLVLMALV